MEKTAKMQYCFNCGAELGVFVRHWRDIEPCTDPACVREARDAERARDEEAQEAARDDNYERYR